MGKRAAVTKEEVKTFIDSYKIETNRLPTVTEIRNHFGIGSMNRYSEILKEMAEPPKSKIGISLTSDEVHKLQNVISDLFDRKASLFIESSVRQANQDRKDAMMKLADAADEIEEYRAKLIEKDLEHKEELKQQREQFTAELTAQTTKFVTVETQMTLRISELEKEVQRLKDELKMAKTARSEEQHASKVDEHDNNLNLFENN